MLILPLIPQAPAVPTGAWFSVAGPSTMAAQGSGGGSSAPEWLIGLVFVVLVVVARPLASLMGRQIRRRRDAHRFAAPPGDAPAGPVPERPAPGPEPAIRIPPVGSIGFGGGGRDTRVGGGQSLPVRSHGEDRDRAPIGRPVGDGLDDVPAVDEAGDDMFRHPDLRSDH